MTEKNSLYTPQTPLCKVCGIPLTRKLELKEGRCYTCIENKRFSIHSPNKPDYDYLWRKKTNTPFHHESLTHKRKQKKLSYTKTDLLNLLKRHSKKKGYHYCPYTANSIEMLFNFITIENKIPNYVSKTAISYIQHLLNQCCLSGKSRLPIAAAIYYFASITTGFRLTQPQVSAFFFVTPVSLRTRGKEILPLIKDLIFSNKIHTSPFDIHYPSTLLKR